MDMSAVSSLLASLSAMKDIAQTMVGLRDGQIFQAKLLEFQAKLIETNSSALAAQHERFALLEDVRQLKKELTDLKAWEGEKQRYELADVGGGSLAYVLKPAMAAGEHPHQICASCYHKGYKSILQPKTVLRSGYLACHDCGSELKISEPDRSTPLPTHSANPNRRR